jgi:hypothetical protein
MGIASLWRPLISEEPEVVYRTFPIPLLPLRAFIRAIFPASLVGGMRPISVYRSKPPL